MLHPAHCSTRNCRFVEARRCFVCDSPLCGSCSRPTITPCGTVTLCKSPACQFALKAREGWVPS